MSDRRVWFHIIISTYGSWLPGDPRGFRTRDHREHVAGDYKQPPPTGMYAARYRASEQRLKQPPVTLDANWRKVLGMALRDKLIQLKGRVLSICCADQHSLIQVELTDVNARQPVGIAKKHATFTAHPARFVGKLWAVRSQIVRIRDRQHQRHVYRYILAHGNQGAWVWSEPKNIDTEEARG